jgi:hypothetical protein
VNQKIFIAIVAGALALMTASCASDNTTNANVNSNVAPATTTAGPDNSEIVTTNENGVRTETRTFRDNPRVSKVVVTTRDGNRTVKVYSRTGEEKEVSKDGSPDVLQATGDAIADSAGWVKDKSLTVADKTKEGAKTVADKTVDTSKTVANKTVDVSKTVADKTVDTSKTVANKTKAGAKKTGRAIRKVIP